MRQWYQCLLSVTRGDNFYLLEIMAPSVETDRKKHETAGFLWVWKLHESRGRVCLLFHCVLCAWNIIHWTHLFFLRVNEQINELKLYPCFPTNKRLDCKIWPSPLEQASPNSIRIKKKKKHWIKSYHENSLQSSQGLTQFFCSEIIC